MDIEHSLEVIPDSIRVALEQQQQEYRNSLVANSSGVKAFAAVSLLGLAPMPILSLEGMASFVRLFNDNQEVIFYTKYSAGSVLAVLAFIPSAWFAYYGSSLFARRMAAAENKSHVFFIFLPYYVVGVLVAGGTFYFATQAFDFEVLPEVATYCFAGVVAGFTGFPNGSLLQALMAKLSSYPVVKAMRYAVQQIFCCCSSRKKRLYHLEQALETQCTFVVFELDDAVISKVVNEASSILNVTREAIVIVQKVQQLKQRQVSNSRFTAYWLTDFIWLGMAITANLLYLGPGAMAAVWLLRQEAAGIVGQIVVVGGNAAVAWYCVSEGVNKRIYTQGSNNVVKKYFVRSCLIAAPAALFGITLAALASQDLPFALVTGGCNFIILLLSQAFSYIALKEQGQHSREKVLRLLKAVKTGLDGYSDQALSYLEQLLGLETTPIITRAAFLPPPQNFEPLEVEERPSRSCCCLQ